MKRSPEAEQRRLAALRIAVRRPEYRERKRRELAARRAAGWRPNFNTESFRLARKAVGEKRRGYHHTAASKARMSVAMLTRIARHNPFVTRSCACGCGAEFRVRQQHSKRFVHGHQRRGTRACEETKRRQSSGLKRAWRAGKFKNVRIDYEAIAAKNRNRKRPREAILATKRGVILAWQRGQYDGTKSARGPQNASSKQWRIRSPDNVVYGFTNLSDWVRNHEHLFAPTDVQWRKQGKHWKCRALGGLQSLSTRKRVTQGRWKGWTWVSYFEVKQQQGKEAGQ